MRMTSSVMLTLTMTMMMQEAVTHSQGNKWEEILRRAPTISRVFTRIWKKNWKQHESSPTKKELFLPAYKMMQTQQCPGK